MFHIIISHQDAAHFAKQMLGSVCIERVLSEQVLALQNR